MARSLNKVQLIGNLTRDPELRYTPQGSAVCSFSVATNRQWKTDSGEDRDEAEFHRIVSWNQLAEICSKILKKGTKVFVEGRIQSRDWTGQDGQKRTTVEIVISEMIALDSRGSGGGDYSSGSDIDIPEDLGGQDAEGQQDQSSPKSTSKKSKKSSSKKSKKTKKDEGDEEDEIPF